MIPLSQALERMQPSATRKEPSLTSSPMQPHGSISGAGKATTPPHTSTGIVSSPESPHRPVLPPTKPLPKLKITVGSDPKSREDVREFILVCFDALDTYGKTPDQLGNAVKLFILTLADYPVPLVRNAFIRWAQERSKMPSPADIISLIKDDNEQIMKYLKHVSDGGVVSSKAEEFIVEKLGKNWREYV